MEESKSNNSRIWIFILVPFICLVFVFSFSFSEIFFDNKKPFNESAVQRITSAVDSEKKIINPFKLAPEDDLNVQFLTEEKLLNWDEFKILIKAADAMPQGFRSALQRKIKLNKEEGSILIVELNSSLTAINFAYSLNYKNKFNWGLEIEDYFISVSNRFLHLSPINLYSSIRKHKDLHERLARNFEMRLINLRSINLATSMRIVELEWDGNRLGEALELRMDGEIFHLIPEFKSKLLDSKIYIQRKYSIGDLSFSRVKSSVSGSVFYADQLEQHLLIHSGLGHDLNLSEKYLLRRIFR